MNASNQPVIASHTEMVTVSTLRDQRETNVFQLVADQAALRPQATAIIAADGTPTTYGELVARAAQIANELVERGLQPEQTVGVIMHRTPELMATLLGILRAGGAYVPLDPGDPIERSRRMLEGAGCRLVIGHTGPLAALRDIIISTTKSKTSDTTNVPEFLDVERLGRKAETPMSACAPGGNRLAYVLFTSGSTGAPKGVEIEHRNMTWLLACAQEMFAFTANDRYIATATVAFDISVAELYLPLVTGGSMLLRDRDLLLRPHELAQEITRHGVTVFQTGPSLWKVILNGLPNFPHLRVAVTTGEATPPELASRLASIADRVWNLYGPTETTVWTTGARLDLPHCLSHGRSTMAAPIGWPMTDVEMIVVDTNDQEVANDVQGELLLGGPAVGRGYYGNPDLTARQFITLANGRRYYRSGDLSEKAADGSFAFHGRNDDQIKVRGVRIEPMEIESTLLDDPCVARAAATWFPTAGGNRALVAAIVCKASTPTTASELHDRLAVVLPVQMVPSRYIFRDSLPLTPSGKVDRVAIREQAIGDGSGDNVVEDLESFSETERKIAEIWKQTLKVQSVVRNDHFFSVGGDSLAAVTMMLDIEETFQMSLPVQMLFDFPKLSDLAAHLDERTQVRIDSSATGDANQVEKVDKAIDNTAFVFPLVASGTGRPVFFASIGVAATAKGVWTPDCPLYAVAYAAHGKGLLRAPTLEGMAAVHVRAIREIQPIGPYRIAGYSFGGLVAIEIARQLRGQGEDIELLFLLDPTEPIRTYDASHTERVQTIAPPAMIDEDSDDKNVDERVHETVLQRSARHVRQTAQNPRASFSYAKAKVPLIPAALLNSTAYGPFVSHYVHDFHLKHPNPLLKKLLPTNHWTAFWYGAERLMRTYVVHPQHGPVLAVFLREGDRGTIWRRYLDPNAEIRRVATTHHGLFVEPAMSAWISILADRLRQLDDPAQHAKGT